MELSEEEILQLLNRLLEKLHQADGNNKKSSTVINIYSKGSQHIDCLEKQYIYGEACSKLIRDNKEIPPDLPSSLSTDEAMVLWEKAQEAGYVDDNYQPLISRTQSALLACVMAKHLSIEHKWKVFGELWNRKYMYRDYYEALNQKKSLEFQDELKKIFI